MDNLERVNRSIGVAALLAQPLTSVYKFIDCCLFSRKVTCAQIFTFIAVFVVLATAKSNLAFANDQNCQVAAPDKFFPKHGSTAAPTNELPVPPTNNDCAFYNWAWQTFLFVTERKANSKPAFLSYPTIERAFPKVFGKQSVASANKGSNEVLTLSIRNIEPILNEATRSARPSATNDSGDPTPVLTDGVMQASQGGPGAVLVDQSRNPVFYTIHVNDVFARFVQEYGLDDVQRLLADPSKDSNAVPAELEFHAGSLEIKSSWMILDQPASGYPNYIVTRAKVPYLKNEPNSNGNGTHLAVDTSRPFRDVSVALLALHVVGAIDGHPEFIWATFEHADNRGNRDIAPAADGNPDPAKSPSQTIAGSDQSYPLFKANTPVDQANKSLVQPIGADQKFASSTSIYREFPGSASTKPDHGLPASPWEDPAVFTLNQHMSELFNTNDPGKKDWRRNYRLVAAVWIDLPRKNNNFDAGQFFTDDDARLAGENRLSNMATESFTQAAGTGAPHCFSCHDTQIQDQLPGGRQLPARRINVSHIFSIVAKKFLASQQQ
jgi:hypothetical protein